MKLPIVTEQKRLVSPAPAPQALAIMEGRLLMGSRDQRRLYQLDRETGKVLSEQECPGIPWAAVATRDVIRFTIGEGPNDDRYVVEYRGAFEGGNDDRVGPDGLPARFACPEFTGSYLSWDGQHLYLSQWYKHRILQIGPGGEILRGVDVGEEVSGHTFVDGWTYVLRGTEQNGESWRIARFRTEEDNPKVMDLAQIPFACRSLTFDGSAFWSNHRAAGEIISFTLP